MKVVSKEATIVYDLEGTLIELYGITDDTTPFEFRILDVEQDQHEMSTTLKCNDLNNIVLTIEHFIDEFKKLKL